jgi:hypothetical protein
MCAEFPGGRAYQSFNLFPRRKLTVITRANKKAFQREPFCRVVVRPALFFAATPDRES